MKRDLFMRARLAPLGLALVVSICGFWSSTTAVSAAPSLLDQCVSSINETGFSKQFIIDETGFADEDALLAAVSSGAWTLQISTGSGWNPTLRGNSPDIYCGDSGNNTVAYLDSNPSGSHDFFFGGAGNDTVDTMWDSRYWGGSGDDRINNNRERSIFYGGPGNDFCGNRESSGIYIATCIEDGGPLASQASLSVVANTFLIGNTLTLTTSGGSGSGAVSFSLVSAGSAGCSLVSAVLSATSVGTCTVSATKNFDSTYDLVTSTNTTITVTALPTTTTTTTTTVAPVLDIVVVAPSTTVAVGQSQIPVVSSVPKSSVTTLVPKVVATTTTTTTTTTVPVAPSGTVAPKAPSAPEVVAGAASLKVGNKTETATVERADNQLIVSAGALKAVVGGVNPDGSQMSLDNDGNVRLNAGDTIRIKLAGFEPGTVMEAWLFSTPVLLGTTKVGSDGTVTGTFTLPKNAPEGAHRVVVVAQTTDGKPATLAVGINVGEWDSGPGVAIWLIVLPIAFAVVGALVVPAQRRRRRTSTAQ